MEILMFERPRPFKRDNLLSRRSILARESDSLFSDIRKYQTGDDEQGNPRFAIPLKADDDGLLGRECPSTSCALRYFKISIEKDDSGEEHLTDAQLHCPYCGTIESFQEFHTSDQIKMVETMMLRDVEQSIVNQLNRSFQPLNNRRGLLNIKMKATATLPQVHQYVEKKLKQTSTCAQCSQQYAVYGVSYHCPFCGGGTLAVHLHDSAETIRVLAVEAELIGKKYGAAAHDKMLGNAYEDAVTTFEGFLRRIYGGGLRKRLVSQDSEKLESKVKNAFQRLDSAEVLFLRDLTIELFQGVTQNDRDRLTIVFCKRHALTHNLGLVDQKYRDQVQAWEKPGQEVPLKASEILWAIDLIERMLCDAASQAGL
jgi:C4-type Zn-finger protein